MGFPRWKKQSTQKSPDKLELETKNSLSTPRHYIKNITANVLSLISREEENDTIDYEKALQILDHHKAANIPATEGSQSAAHDPAELKDPCQ